MVWNPHTAKYCALLDAVQNWAARWVVGSHWNPVFLRWTKSSSDCVLTLNWQSLSTSWKYFIIMFFMDYLHQLSKPMHLLPQSRDTRSHELTFCTISFTINSYRFSLVVNGIFRWNKLPTFILDLGNSISTLKTGTT